MTPLRARRLLLGAQALLGPRPAGGLKGLIDQLGYVQMDSINVVERAHHLILGARLDEYEPKQFEALQAERHLFEHWTHDASAIPVAHYPHWKVRFPRSRARILASAWWRERVGAEREALLTAVLARVREEGPLGSSAFDQGHPGKAGGWWDWKPQKAALEFLWHTGELAVAHRVHFQKVFDLPERVFPGPAALPCPDEEAHRDWACASALERLGVATPKELAAFWNAVEPVEAAAWCAQAVKAGRIRKVEVQDGETDRACFAVNDWEARLAALPEAPATMTLLCPFDPILRDRNRALRLFGFDYRFEAFVPEAKRQYGYYVLPILEGDALVGRLDPKFHRSRRELEVQGLWWEKGLRGSKVRMKRLEAALERLATRIGAKTVTMPVTS